MSKDAEGSMFMSAEQMRLVAAKMRYNNPKPGGVSTQSELLLHQTLMEFSKAMDDVANDLERPPRPDWNNHRIRPRG